MSVVPLSLQNQHIRLQKFPYDWATNKKINLNYSMIENKKYHNSLNNDPTSSLQLHPHTYQIVTSGFVDRLRRSDCTAGQMDGEAAS